MATVTKVSGLKTAHSTAYSVGGIKHMRIQLRDGSNTSIVNTEGDGYNEVLDLVLQEINPLWYVISSTYTLLEVFVSDNVDSADLQLRIRNLYDPVNGGAGVNNIDISGTLVEDNYYGYISGALATG